MLLLVIVQQIVRLRCKSFTGLNVEAGHSLVVYHGGTVWFTITAQASGGTSND
jgi:hypothetical protein